MRARLPLIAANWKMHKTAGEAHAFCDVALPRLLALTDDVEVALCPPFTALHAVAERVRATPVRLGAQDLHWERAGAFTGEVSGPMLVAAGCTYVIVGHSERRELFAETDDRVRRKVRAAFDAGLVPILCVGETLRERQDRLTEERIAAQLAEGTASITSEEAARLVIAYEPVWAIGTGRAATPEDARRVIGWIRDVMRQRFGPSADRMRIQYGGSVNPDNAAGFLQHPEIDGSLVGGASLDPEAFVRIVEAALPARV
ncbi:MAG: triose-phosphate isomerase [Armatimonadota bacterium]|nr:triose-phosphate isomerase [Armatimonadota bacterium]MDR5696230.1 triose-phosphate isomerase [Armatimonadota bacterium]